MDAQVDDHGIAFDKGKQPMDANFIDGFDPGMWDDFDPFFSDGSVDGNDNGSDTHVEDNVDAKDNDLQRERESGDLESVERESGQLLPRGSLNVDLVSRGSLDSGQRVVLWVGTVGVDTVDCREEVRNLMSDS
ncbi:hypothetical protein L6452_35052 [Arctium lappa]|uniref:Uncharacterized protein n=1 Tax=Arctium lappa TaxID=4217 RepID=A0ACB8YLF4_ARCLA|nr:hypothetical protein L6452_35052 [Arctium lappa]